MDFALVQFVNRLCRHLAITPARLHPHEVYVDAKDAADPQVACLLGKSISIISILCYAVSFGLWDVFMQLQIIQSEFFFTRICNFDHIGVPVESLRLRFALLQSLNSTLESFFLPLVELRLTQTYQNSIATLLCEAKGQSSNKRAHGPFFVQDCFFSTKMEKYQKIQLIHKNTQNTYI